MKPYRGLHRTMCSIGMIVAFVSGGNASGQCQTDGDCEQGERCCNQLCRNVASDPAYCGSCTNACGASEWCAGGTCACLRQDGAFERCGSSELCCPGVGCANLSNDSANCGVCGFACGSGEVCYTGRCLCGSLQAAQTQQVCASDEACCGSPAACVPALDCQCGTSVCGEAQACCIENQSAKCVNLKTDVSHCGSCGNECGPGKTCVRGTCQITCTSGYAACGDVCADLLRDRHHCGTCGNACAPGEICNGAGECRLSCQAGSVDCYGECVDLERNRDHCGACGSACATGEICNGTGQCRLSCQPGFVDCYGECADLLQNRDHCGACGSACAPGEICNGAGECRLSCQPGFVDCYGECADLLKNRDHCGACGIACGSGEVCNGAAQCEPTCLPGQTFCGSECVNLLFDRRHCGACSVACGPGEVCDGTAQCSVTCGGGLKDCGGTCVDVRRDSRHCGACGHTCPDGWECLLGACHSPCAAGGTADCGDLDLDVLITHPSEGVFSGFRNNGDGLLGPRLTHATEHAPLISELADMNQDGRLDVVLVLDDSRTRTSRLAVYLTVGDIEFVQAVGMAWGSTISAVAVADLYLDRDRALDVAVADVRDRIVGVFENNGDGTVTERTRVEAGSLIDLVAGDVTGDGIADLIGAGATVEEVVVLENGGGGDFRRYTVPARLAGPPTALLAVDLDHRNGLDIVVAMMGSGESGLVGVLLNRGDGSFDEIRMYPTGSEPIALGAGHLNDDAFQDIVVLNTRSGSLTVLWNTGNGGMEVRGNITACERPRDVALGDLNSDGFTDAVVLCDHSSLRPLINNGGRTLLLQESVNIVTNGSSLALGDLESARSCTDLATNAFHCGACGNVCPIDEYCRDGQCVLKADIDESGEVDLRDFHFLQRVYGTRR